MVTISEESNICRISRDGTTEVEFSAEFNPSAAMAILLEINSLRDESGEAIFRNYRIGQTYTWSMLQEHLFWEYLQPFVKYRPVIEWLVAHPEEKVATSLHGVNVWQALLGLHNTGAETGSDRAWRHEIEKLFLIVNASVCGIWNMFRGGKFLLWSLNCVWGNRWIDYRLKDVYSALWENQIRFLEGFPFPGFKTVFHRTIGSRRLAFYAPNILRILPKARLLAEHKGYDWNPLQKISADVARPLVRHFEVLAANASLHARLLGLLLKLAGLRRIAGIDEHTSFAALICAARALGIETIGLQHGVFHKYSIGWTTPGIPRQYTAGYDRILVWGEVWRDLLSELSTTYDPARLPIAGFIRPSTINLPRRQAATANEPFTILLPYEFLANANEIGDYVRAFVARGFRVLFKVRFDDTLDQQIKMIPRDQVELVPELTPEILNGIHVCAGTSTTMMYELLFLGIPAWFIETKHDSNIHMVDMGLASRITLEMLSSPSFDPLQHILPLPSPERIFRNGGIPDYLVHFISSSNPS